MDLYFERHDGQAVTIEDFLAAFADATGTDLDQFKLWYCAGRHAGGRGQGRLRRAPEDLHADPQPDLPPTPGQTIKQPMHIPVRFGLVGPNGADLAFESADGGRSRATSST